MSLPKLFVITKVRYESRNQTRKGRGIPIFKKQNIRLGGERAKDLYLTATTKNIYYSVIDT